MTTKTSSRIRLTPKQEAFCVFYDVLKNGTQSAIKAGYSPTTAQEISSENLSKPIIQRRLAEFEANRPSDPDIATVDERRRRLTSIYRANLTDFTDKDGHITFSKDIPHHEAVQEYSVTTKYGGLATEKSIKLLNPISAIQEHNKMERIGAQDNQLPPNINILFVIGKGYQEGTIASISTKSGS